MKKVAEDQDKRLDKLEKSGKKRNEQIKELQEGLNDVGILMKKNQSSLLGLLNTLQEEENRMKKKLKLAEQKNNQMVFNPKLYISLVDFKQLAKLLFHLIDFILSKNLGWLNL